MVQPLHLFHLARFVPAFQEDLFKIKIYRLKSVCFILFCIIKRFLWRDKIVIWIWFNTCSSSSARSSVFSADSVSSILSSFPGISFVFEFNKVIKNSLRYYSLKIRVCMHTFWTLDPLNSNRALNALNALGTRSSCSTLYAWRTVHTINSRRTYFFKLKNQVVKIWNFV